MVGPAAHAIAIAIASARHPASARLALVRGPGPRGLPPAQVEGPALADAILLRHRPPPCQRSGALGRRRGQPQRRSALQGTLQVLVLSDLFEWDTLPRREVPQAVDPLSNGVNPPLKLLLLPLDLRLCPELCLQRDLRHGLPGYGS